MDLSISRHDVDPGRDDTEEPARNYVVVLVSGVHNATLQAIECAETLTPTDLRAVSFGLDPRPRRSWETTGFAVASRFRWNSTSHRIETWAGLLFHTLSSFEPTDEIGSSPSSFPEFVAGKLRHQFLHGQTALLAKRHFLFESGVVVASVPYHLGTQPPD